MAATPPPQPPLDAVAVPMACAFITWDAALGRRMCPLATFGSRAPLVHSARLVCVDPPRADRESLANAADVNGAIALVVRGGCSFLEKARRIQSAGAVAMILANNTREEPFAMFTMAADGEDPSSVTMPCVMMCLYDVRELFKQFPPTVKTGVLTLEIHTPDRQQEIVAECESQRLLAMQQHAKDGSGSSSASSAQETSGWGAALKRKTTSLIKRWESTGAASESTTKPPPPVAPETQAVVSPSPQSIAQPSPSPPAIEIKPKAPLFAFVQWPTSASTFVLFFAPIADFCLVANGAIYEGHSVVCDPLLADQDPIRNASELVDAIVLVQRGACTFPAKLERVQRCGAAAVIVGNNDAQDADAAFVMSVDHIRVDHVTIPAVMVSKRVFARVVEGDRPTQLRILCLSGEAAIQCLERAGQELSITEIALPQVDKKTKSNNDVETNTEDGESSATTCEDGDDSMITEDAELDPVTRLHVACRAGDHGGCQRVMDETCANESARRELVMARDQFQLTALHHACAAEEDHAGVEHVVSLLLRYGAAPTARDMVLNTPLHLACLRGHTASVKKLLSTASSSSSASSFSQKELTMARNLGGATPIHYAAMAGSTECVELLLSVNARRVDGEKYCFDGVDEQDVDGATPLHVACMATHTDCVMYLVAANADLTLRDKLGRTPLQIACALVNEPSRSLQALHIVEKLMDAGAPVVIEPHEDETDQRHQLLQQQSNPLAIDCVASKTVKRELEVSFLRRETLQSRTAFKTLSQQLDRQNEEVTGLQMVLETMTKQSEQTKRAVRERELQLFRQQKQIDQLQLQMKTLLQVQHSGGGFDSTSCSAGAMALLAGPSRSKASQSRDDLPTGEEHQQDVTVSGSDEESDTEAARAQDAALARDLGRKCCREGQFALAETYFERSLELFALPGVAKLLEDARSSRSKADTPLQHSTPRDGTMNENATDKDTDVTKLRSLLTDLAASQRTKQALGREITKLEALCAGSSEYNAAFKWIEWLLVLPWNEASTTPNSELLALEATMFDEIERLESEHAVRQRHYAARVVQRAFRKRYAVFFSKRVVASELIQRSYRAFRLKRSEHERSTCDSSTRISDHDALLVQGDQPSDGSEKLDENHGTNSQPPVFDAAVIADPFVLLRLPKRRRIRVVKGTATEIASQVSVLQLLAAEPKPHNVDPASYFVWRRWGASAMDTRESVLCGPYEDLKSATLRYERMLRDHATVDANLSPETAEGDDTIKLAALPPSDHVAWTSLRASAS